ncbi:hypothetical protein, partial [Stenotrophomonas sp. HMWF003]|uniref:hypothetical protein n=1 Tax=Stenotrophomonas sp. HMWF003 TaxID=2056840 RepID=UPI001C62533E
MPNMVTARAGTCREPGADAARFLQAHPEKYEGPHSGPFSAGGSISAIYTAGSVAMSQRGVTCTCG